MVQFSGGLHKVNIKYQLELLCYQNRVTFLRYIFGTLLNQTDHGSIFSTIYSMMHLFLSTKYKFLQPGNKVLEIVLLHENRNTV